MTPGGNTILQRDARALLAELPPAFVDMAIFSPLSGIEQEGWGTMPWVTGVVPDDRRATLVASALGRQPRELRPVFQVVSITRAVDVLIGARP